MLRNCLTSMIYIGQDMRKNGSHLKNIFLILLVLLISSYVKASQSFTDPRSDQFETLLSKYYKTGLFTGNVLIAEKGKVIFSKSYGLANREHEVANKSMTKFRVGSITKQFTASAIMILQQQGLLSVHDPIRKYIPDYPKVGEKITIHHLLTHTSGIPEYMDFPDFDKMMVRHISLEDLVDYFKNKPLDFEPGSKWSYSNSGYLLLGFIIERISHMPYEEFLKKYIFDVAHLNETIPDRPINLIIHRAQGYDLIPGGIIKNAAYIDLSIAQAAGDLLSTTNDLLKWDRILYGSSILSDTSKSEMFKDQTGFSYGYGWSIDNAFGHRRVRHGGAISGFLAEFARYIDVDATIIVCSNLISGPPNRDIADALASILFNVSNDSVNQTIAAS